jgi:DDE superfamily endonuclease
MMPLYFFQEGPRVNSAAYIEVSDTVVKPWIDRVRNGMTYIFQQESAPSHEAQNTQEWLADHFYDHITPNLWPSYSPDLNPLDYYVWDVAERDINKRSQNAQHSLKASIVTVMDNIDMDHLIRACGTYRSRIEAVIEAKRDSIH